MDALVVRQLNLGESEVNLRELKAGWRGGDGVKEELGRVAERARHMAAMPKYIITGDCGGSKVGSW